jgi:hypothetical protein
MGKFLIFDCFFKLVPDMAPRPQHVDGHLKQGTIGQLSKEFGGFHDK